MSDEDKKKQIKNITEAVFDKERTGSAKEKAAELKKTLDHQTELLKVFEGGIPMNLGIADKKAIVSAAQQAGIEVTDKDEDRAFETEKFLIQLAFKAKKEKLTADKLAAKEAGNRVDQTLLGMKGFWLNSTNKITEGLFNVKEGVAKGANFDNVTDAFKQDFSMLTMAFQGIMEVPGMKTIVAGIKYIASWAAKIIGPWLKKAGKFLWGKGKSLLGMGGKKEGLAKAGKATVKRLRHAAGTIIDGKKVGGQFIGKPKDEKGLSDASGILPGKKGKEKLEKITKPGKGLGSLTKTLKVLEKPLKSLARTLKRFVRILKMLFSAKMMFALMKAAKKNKKFTKMFTKILRFMANAMKKLVKAFMLVAKALIRVVGQFLVQVGLFIVNMLVAIAGFIIANLPLIALIALVVLVAIGYYLLIKYIMENWEVVKVKMAMAMDRLKLVGTKISNWFKDAGNDIGYLIKLVIAKMKDGIAGIGNAIITAINDKKKAWFGGDDLIDMRLETGAAGKVKAGRKEDLAGREARDKKLQSDFDAKYAERGKELEEAAKADAERNANKGAGGSTDIKTSTIVNTDNRETTLSAESTQPTDIVTLQAIRG